MRHCTYPGLIALSLAVVGLASCGPNGPPSNSSGSVTNEQMLIFAEQTAGKLAHDIAQVPEIHERDTRAILEAGYIVNKSVMPDATFELAQAKIIGCIVQNKDLQRECTVVQGLDRSAKEFIRSQGPIVEDILQDPKRVPDLPNIYKPQDTFVLTGNTYSTSDGSRTLYYFQFLIYNLKTRSIVFMKDYTENR